ncbi:hypothetical protein [Paenirhodobacter populi]|uniref:hypothetical protein n=1 Tax=Paenirhodobacter populi TaxID=2306993 RepID=UPI0019D46562|nr:hypothetical protein [Sinirhodobacter populi]
MTVVASGYERRLNELYETEPWAVEACVRTLKTLGMWSLRPIWEPAAGKHAMVEPLIQAGASEVLTSDICDYGTRHTALFDFLKDDSPSFLPAEFDIITNPPYGRHNHLAAKFARKALERCDGMVALLLTAKFDFGNTRTSLFRDSRRFLAKVALIDRMSLVGNGKGGTEDHAWFIWGPCQVDNAYPILLYEENREKRRQAMLV